MIKLRFKKIPDLELAVEVLYKHHNTIWHRAAKNTAISSLSYRE